MFFSPNGVPMSSLVEHFDTRTILLSRTVPTPGSTPVVRLLERLEAGIAATPYWVAVPLMWAHAVVASVGHRWQ